jgi:MerR family mercuric resistance operon transcriptional regulator
LTLYLGTGFIVYIRGEEMENVTIGKLAKNSGVNIETIRYYERRGLIQKPMKKPSGYRQYPPETTTRIRFIKHAQELGFSLNEITELLSLRLDRKTPCLQVKKRAEAKISDIEKKMQILQKMKKALVNLTNSCSGRGPVSECPILEALDK